MSRNIANEAVFPIGLGCMNLSHAYGEPLSEADGVHLLQQALELGINHFDTATLYGFGKNETLVGSVLKDYRSQVFLASKCGMSGVDGKRVIDGRPETIKAQCDASLQCLQTDVIDLYYLHRWDKRDGLRKV
ncbi:aldo/keto reductase [Oligella ureolytica]